MPPEEIAATATIYAAWIALAAGLAGVILTLIAAAVGAGIQARREHKKWLRDQRLRAYADALSASDNLLRAGQHDTDGSEFAVVTTEAIRSLSVIQLLGPDSLSKCADAYQAAVKTSLEQLTGTPKSLSDAEDKRLARRGEFIAAARQQVKIKA